MKEQMDRVENIEKWMDLIAKCSAFLLIFIALGFRGTDQKHISHLNPFNYLESGPLSKYRYFFIILLVSLFCLFHILREIRYREYVKSKKKK